MKLGTITISVNGDSDYPYSFYNLNSLDAYGKFIQTMELLLKANNNQDDKELMDWFHIYVEPTNYHYPHLYP